MPGILVEIVGDARQFKRELDKAVSSTSKANKGFSKMGKVAGVAGLAIGGALAAGLVKSTKAAMDSQRVQAQTESQLKALGISYKNHAKQIDTVITATSKLSAIDDEELQGSFNDIVRVTHNVNTALRDTALAADISRGKHIDLAAAAKIVQKAQMGMVGSLKRVGIEIAPVTTAVDKLKDSKKKYTDAEMDAAKAADLTATKQAAIAKLQGTFAGAAKAYGETAQGAQDRMRVSIENLEESIGTLLLPVVEKLSNGIARAADWMERHKEITKLLIIGIAGLAAAFLVLSAAVAVVELAMSPLLVPILAVIAIIGVLSFVVYKLVTDFKKNWDLLFLFVAGPIGLMIVVIKRFHTQIVEIFTAAWNAVKGIFSSALNALLGLVRGAVGAAGAAAKAVGQAILDGIMDKVRAIADKARAAFSAVWAAIRGLVGLAASAGRAIGEAVTHGIIDGLTSLAGKAAGVIKSVIGHLPHISIPGFSPIQHVGVVIGEMIGHGVAEGILKSKPRIHNALINGIASAKAGADDWIGDVGVDNMTEQGGILATALGDGIKATHDIATNLGAFQPGLSGAALVNAPYPMQPTHGANLVNGPAPIVINVTGSVMTERQLVDVVRDGMIRSQKRNGSLGFT